MQEIKHFVVIGIFRYIEKENVSIILIKRSRKDNLLFDSNSLVNLLAECIKFINCRNNLSNCHENLHSYSLRAAVGSRIFLYILFLKVRIFEFFKITKDL